MSMEQFEKFAKDYGLQITAQNVAARTDRSGEDWDKDAIHFLVTITRLPRSFEPSRPGHVVWSGFYSVGSAHPEMWAKENKGKVGYQVRQAMRQIANSNPRSNFAHAARQVIREAYAKAAPLKIGDVLWSLQMDVMGADQPFADWASDFGMSDDSIKAKGIWEAVNDTRRALQSALGREAFEKFSELEEI